MWVTVVATGFSLTGTPGTAHARADRPQTPAPDDLLEPPSFLQG